MFRSLYLIMTLLLVAVSASEQNSNNGVFSPTVFRGALSQDTVGTSTTGRRLGFATGMKAGVQGAFQATKSGLSNAGTGLSKAGTKLSSGFGSMVKAMKTMPGNIGKFLTNLPAKIKALIQRIMNVIKGMFAKNKDTAVKAVQNAADELEHVPGLAVRK